MVSGKITVNESAKVVLAISRFSVSSYDVVNIVDENGLSVSTSKTDDWVRYPSADSIQQTGSTVVISSSTAGTTSAKLVYYTLE